MSDFQSGSATDTVGTELVSVDPAVFEAKMRAYRREKRMDALQDCRKYATGLVAWIGDGAHDQLDDRQQKNWDRKVSSPGREMDLATRAVVRVIAAEERLDEDAETRAARIAKEQAERAEARKAQIPTETEIRKTAIRRTVAGIYRDAEPNLSWIDRELDLEELFAEFEEDDGEDPVETVARLCARLGYAPEPQELPDGSTETPEEAKERTLTLARDYYDSYAAANGNRVEPVEEEVPPPARAQGPPG